LSQKNDTNFLYFFFEEELSYKIENKTNNELYKIEEEHNIEVIEKSS